MEKWTQSSNEKLNFSKEHPITKEAGYEVLNNLEITEKNQEFVTKMAQIEFEMDQRKRILKQDSDTEEILKTGKSEFDELKADTIKETRKELTKTSKYVAGAVISGLAAGIIYAGGQLGVDSFLADKLANAVAGEHGNPSEWLKVFNEAEIAEVVTMVGAAGLSLWKAGRAISQEIKTRVASNQKVQRIIAMIAEGMKKEGAQKIVGMETNMKSGEYSGYQWAGEKTRTGSPLSNDEIGKIKAVREKLEEMGIKRISREKYKG